MGNVEVVEVKIRGVEGEWRCGKRGKEITGGMSVAGEGYI